MWTITSDKNMQPMTVGLTQEHAWRNLEDMGYPREGFSISRAYKEEEVKTPFYDKVWKQFHDWTKDTLYELVDDHGMDFADALTQIAAYDPEKVEEYIQLLSQMEDMFKTIYELEKQIDLDHNDPSKEAIENKFNTMTGIAPLKS